MSNHLANTKTFSLTAAVYRAPISIWLGQHSSLVRNSTETVRGRHCLRATLEAPCLPLASYSHLQPIGVSRSRLLGSHAGGQRPLRGDLPSPCISRLALFGASRKTIRTERSYPHGNHRHLPRFQSLALRCALDYMTRIADAVPQVNRCIKIFWDFLSGLLVVSVVSRPLPGGETEHPDHM